MARDGSGWLRKYCHCHRRRHRPPHRGCIALYRGSRAGCLACLAGVSRVSRGCVAGVSQLYRGCNAAVTRLYPGCIAAASRVSRCFTFLAQTDSRVSRRFAGVSQIRGRTCIALYRGCHSFSRKLSRGYRGCIAVYIADVSRVSRRKIHMCRGCLAVSRGCFTVFHTCLAL
eukprot:1646371-Prymnesium_polylepis.1